MALAQNLATYQTGSYYFNIKVTNNLPQGYQKLVR